VSGKNAFACSARMSLTSLSRFQFLLLRSSTPRQRRSITRRPKKNDANLDAETVRCCGGAFMTTGNGDSSRLARSSGPAEHDPIHLLHDTVEHRVIQSFVPARVLHQLEQRALLEIGEDKGAVEREIDRMVGDLDPCLDLEILEPGAELRVILGRAIIELLEYCIDVQSRQRLRLDTVLDALGNGQPGFALDSCLSDLRRRADNAVNPVSGKDPVPQTFDDYLRESNIDDVCPPFGIVDT
jgi:hypothetical protein